MCQILVAEVPACGEAIEDVLYQNKTIKTILDEKGGESYSFTVYCKLNKEYKTFYVTGNKDSEYEEIWEQFEAYTRDLFDRVNKIFNPRDYDEADETNFIFVFFSRQAPEMEDNTVSAAPYLVNNKLVWMHGTVANLPEIEEHLNIKFEVDSQVLAHAEQLVHDGIIIEGVYTGHTIDVNSGVHNILYNGIGLWQGVRYIQDDEFSIIWTSTSPTNLGLILGYNCEPLDLHPYYMKYVPRGTIKKVIYTAFSGGMDIVLSLYARLHDITKVDGSLKIGESKFMLDTDTVKLIYFDYGARAREQEISTLNRYKEFLEEEFPNINFEAEIHDIRDMFKNLSTVAQFNSKLMSEDSEGDISETESNAAYVPYRNTEFALLIGALIDRDLEADRFILPEIVYGLNLTEMSVYLDNSANWADIVNRAIMYGGKYYKLTSITTPFVNVTKTNMIAFMIKHFGFDKLNKLLDIAFSCYYPDEDGKPCGKCGSCILRANAIKRATIKLKKERLENGQ